MARTLKGTRARGLPSKVLLSQRQDATGSFPTVWRTSSDNRTGRYPVFFNDDKVIRFNQPVTDAGIFVTTYPEYEENVLTVGSPGNPVNQVSGITFSYSFTGVPVVVLTELTPNPNTPTVNAFIDSLTSSGMTINFSAPFEGTVVYRALYQSSFGNPVNVLRSPRYTDQYSLVVAKSDNLASSNNVYVTFSDFGSVPTENYATFYDFFNNDQANISASLTSSTNTSVQVTGSATAITSLHYMGFGPTTASVDVKGIVYPLVMTPQAIDAGLSEEAKNDLYKQPYFSGSEIFNRPIVASGSMKKDVSDTFVTFTPGQDIEPFQDFANPEVDGKISSSIGGVNPFYATGSLVETTGLGFQQPLWSKNRIEIDITPAAEQTFTLYKSASVGSYPMGYWNPNTKLYEGIGTGKGIDSYQSGLTGLKESLDFQTFGFAPSVDDGIALKAFPAGAYNIIARPISVFGFPYDTKFQPTSSQLITGESIISEPFLLEKLVLQISGTLTIPAVSTTGIMTFYLLNRRSTLPNKVVGEQTIGYIASSSTNVLSTTTSSISTDYFLDLVDHIQFSLSTSLDTRGFLLNREAVITKPSPWTGTVSLQFEMKSVVKSPVGYEESFLMPFSGSLYAAYNCVKCKLNSSGRNQVIEVNGRDWKNSFEKPVVIGTAAENIGGANDSFPVNSEYVKKNPYLLLPSDQLIFGFQLPSSRINDEATHSTFKFATTGINKIILYGSTLRLNPETNQLEEYHDTLNQLLSSNSVHEVIGE